MLAALEERVGRLERKAGFVSRRERQVKGKEDFIARQAGNISRVSEVAAARRELEGLRAEAAVAREELAGMVDRLGDDFADAGRMVGEDATLPLRCRAAACAAGSGFRRATFGTEKAKPAPGAARGRRKGESVAEQEEEAGSSKVLLRILQFFAVLFFASIVLAWPSQNPVSCVIAVIYFLLVWRLMK